MLEAFFDRVNSFLWSWPLIFFFVFIGGVATIVLNFFQFRYFGKSWRLLFGVSKLNKKEVAEMSSMQAFLNTLNSSIGNGSLAGMATAIYSGGPGSAFWVFIVGFFGLIIRFCEVYLSTVKKERIGEGVFGGPMIYLQKLPFGSCFAKLYTFFLLMLAFLMGNAMQVNSIRLSVVHMSGIHPYFITIVVVAFVIFLMLGGAARVLKVSDIIVPIKVGLYFTSAFYVLFYHWKAIIPALKLIFLNAFSWHASAGSVAGYSMFLAIRYGMVRSITATESGVGTAGVLFGCTGSNRPVENGLMALSTSFISNYLVCFILMLIIVASGVWDNGQTSTELTISAFQTAFGSWGGWIITLLSVLFGIGVLVSYAFIGREAWKYLFKGRLSSIYSILYIAFSVFGLLSSVSVVWQLCDLVIAFLMIINIFSILWLLPEIKLGVVKWQRRQSININ